MTQRNYSILGNFAILYIEDEIDILKHTANVMEDFAKVVYAVQSSQEAFEIIKTKKVDAIVSDILLKNENAIEFLRRLKNEFGLEIPTILTTAFTDTDYLLSAIKLKIENYIVKPINVKELLNSLHDILLPRVQEKELKCYYNIIKTIGMVTDSKQVEIVKFIIKNLDENSVLNYSYSEIMERINVSKPTIIKLFKHLSDLNVLVKIKNKKYQFNENNLTILE